MGAISVQDIQRELWYRGELDWKLHAAQQALNEAFLATKGQLFVGNCARQGGKSFWAVTIAVGFAIKHPKSQIRYGAAFHSDLIEFIIPAFEKVMDDCPEEIRGKYRVSGTAFIFPNGSRIKLVGVDKNPNGLRGNTLDLIILDECGFVNNLDYLYKSIIMPATTHRPNCKIILVSTPPATPEHPFVEYCKRAQEEGGYATFTIYDNPMVDEATINRLAKESGGFDSTTWKREYLCQFVTDSETMIVREWDDKYIQPVERDEYFGYYHTYVGMDMGRKDFTALIFGYYDFRKATLVIEDELTMDGPTWTTVTLKDAILAKEKDLWFNKVSNEQKKIFRRVADNNNPHLIMDLNQLHGIHFLETDKESLEAMVNEVRIMVNRGQIQIAPNCTRLIGSLRFGTWDEKRKEFSRSKTLGHMDHLAALIYLVRNLSRTNPIPATHGHVNHKSWIHHVKGQDVSKNARTFGEAILRKKPGVKR